MAKLILDVKETKLAELITDCEKQNLDVGDIHFYKGEELVLVIERKTISDLSASIKDGRWKEQKIRLQSFCKNRGQIMYLIEGRIPSTSYTKGLLPSATLYSAVCSTIIRDGFTVFKTIDINETYTFLMSIKASIEKNNCYYLGQATSQPVDYVDSVAKVKKKDNIDKTNCFILQLACVPGISTYMAKVIVENFPDMKGLLSEIECNGHTLLADLIYTSENGKERKIGPKAAQKIVEFLS
jgi:crossover junction endonuclease MUS81